MSELDRPLQSPALYNPHLLSREELLQLFHARQGLLDRLLDDLRGTPAGRTAQHHLIVGQRGMGKTMLLRRLELAVEDDPVLAKRWIPLTFPEEQYNVAHLSDFWLNCLDALSDRLERQSVTGDVADLDRQISSLDNLPEAERASRALEVLLDTVRSCRRRFLLLVDNADLILDRIEHQEWILREVLSSEPLITFVGASAALLETSYHYDRAFYDFFEVHELSGLSADETRELLLNYARAHGKDEVRRVAEEEPGRLRTLHRLTGGNPRTLVLLFNVLAQTTGGDVRTDLEQLLDQSTPLYKARFEALPPQAQQVVDGLALHWDPVTAGDLAEIVRLEVNAVSSQLNRLVKSGLVEKVPYEPSTRIGYQLAERFFNIWYLMRASRRVRRRLIWLVEFLRMFYSQEELASQATAHLRLLPGTISKDRLRHAEYSFALAQASDAGSLRETLERGALRMLSGQERLRRELRDLIDFDVVEPTLRDRAEELERFEALKRRLRDLQPELQPAAREFAALLLRSAIPLVQKEALVDRLKELTTEQLQSLEGGWNAAEESILSSDDMRENVRRAVEAGVMMSLDDIAGGQDAETVFGVEGLAAVAAAARIELNDDPASLDRLEPLLDSATSAYPWLVWLKRKAHSADTSEVEAAFQKAFPLAARNTDQLMLLGALMRETSLPSRLEKAIRCYREAVAVDSTQWKAWNDLGVALREAGNLREAEEALRKAIELVPTGKLSLQNLGDVLRLNNRIDEAEETYRRALEVDRNDGGLWFKLASLLHDSDRHEEAADAYHLALQADPQYWQAWNNLGILHVKAQRDSEAEEAFRRAIEANAEGGPSWLNLGSLLIYRTERLAEAEEALRKAVVVAPRDPEILSGVAWLFLRFDRDLAEAERWARAAVAERGEHPEATLVLGCILTRTGAWAEAEDAAGMFLGSWTDEVPALWWPMVIHFFREEVAAGRAREAVELVDGSGLGERWRPLREALHALAESNLAFLRRLAPEVREPAETLVARLEDALVLTPPVAPPADPGAPPAPPARGRRGAKPRPATRRRRG